MRIKGRVSAVVIGMVTIFTLGVRPWSGHIQLVPAVQANSEEKERRVESCSVATLEGSYGFATTGSIVAGGPAGLVADVCVLTFDGVGGVSQVETLSLNGTIIPRRTSEGDYLVDADCTGDMTVVLPPPAGAATSFRDVDPEELRSIVTARAGF
jgi:hypothetical protein